MIAFALHFRREQKQKGLEGSRMEDAAQRKMH